MTVTGTMIAAVTPQISIAPQPPISSTELPSDPSRKPGFARQMTNPSYQRSVFRSWRSSTTASATVYLLLVATPRADVGPRGEGSTWCGEFQRPHNGAYEAAVQSVQNAQAPDHDQVRVRRDEGGCLRRALAL